MLRRWPYMGQAVSCIRVGEGIERTPGLLPELHYPCCVKVKAGSKDCLSAFARADMGTCNVERKLRRCGADDCEIRESAGGVGE